MAKLDLGYAEEITRQAKEGDSDSFAELYAATCRKQYRFALLLVKDKHLALEILQDVYVNALRELPRLQDPSMVISWMNRLNLLRCMQVREELRDAVIRCGGETYGVRQVMNLPLSEAQSILLRHVCGLRTHAVAAFLELHAGDVRRYIRNGMRRLGALNGR